MKKILHILLGKGPNSQKSIGATPVDVLVAKRKLDANLTNAESKFATFDDIVFSDKEKPILIRLSAILDILYSHDYSPTHDLRYYVLPIQNYKEEVYAGDKPSFSWKWYYKSQITENGKIHHFELLNGPTKVMTIDTTITLGGTFKSFKLKYYIDLKNCSRQSTNPKENQLGTAIINISLLENGDIMLNHFEYSLDLINTKDFTPKELEDNLVVDCSRPLSRCLRKQ